MAAKHYKLSATQSAALSGFTDVFVVKYTDLSEGTDNTAEAIVLDALAAGDIVKQEAVIKITSPWNGDAALTATVSVGVTSAATALTPALTICTAGSGAAAGVAETSDCQTNAHYVAAAAINLLATFTPDADSALDEFTSGELRIYLTILRNATLVAGQA